MAQIGLSAEGKQRRLNSAYGGEAYTLLVNAKDQAGRHLWRCNTCRSEFVKSFKAMLHIGTHCQQCATAMWKHSNLNG